MIDIQKREQTRLLSVLGVSALAGFRSMAPLALVARRLATHASSSEGLLAHQVAQPVVARGLAALAAGELLADKLPFIPSRTDLLPLGGRTVSGGTIGALLAEEAGQPTWLGAASGAIAAAGATFLSYHMRRILTGLLPLPAFIVALLEDSFVVASATWLLKRLDSARPSGSSLT